MCPLAGCMPLRLVEIDLILKGIKTLLQDIPFPCRWTLVEIDLILKGIKTCSRIHPD